MAKRQSKSRYKLLKQIGAGDFAKVFSAEDTKLGRKVAVKQLHAHFLDDQARLARYWQESQLLVELEHPNIMTIYDIVKSRGSLVLELMQGSLKQVYANKPMPIPDVRETILQAARGLDCLHNRGIIHGDIKPGNLMLSRQNVVKLGDFGLARRVTDDEGSLLKGTTKYMAPELVSEEFGEVGPPSDLYSLGFTALELMVGPEFNSLFPDLVAFGRDPQMAWMMWHCSADRRFPPIQSILKGVPDDLAKVVEKLTAKNQKDRYASAKEVIADLTGGAKDVGVSLQEDEAAAAEAARKHKKKRRIQAAVACVTSLLLCAAIFYFTKEKPAPPVVQAPPPVRGIVQNVLPRDQKFVIDLGADFKEYTLQSDDTIQLNRKDRQLRDLQLGDRVVVNTIIDGDAKRHREVVAFRPEKHSGVIIRIDSENGKMVFSVAEGDDAGQEFSLLVTDETTINLNQQSKSGEQLFGLIDLQPEDRVTVDLSDDVDGMLAVKIDAYRQLELKGVIRKLDPRRGTITIAAETEGDEQLVELPLDLKTVFTLNDVTSIDDRLLTANDIKIGDRVTVQHDVKISKLDAYRAFEDVGRIISIDYGANQFVLDSDAAATPLTYRINDKSQILLGEEIATLTELRVGDSVQLVHESPDDSAPTLLSMNVTRPSDPKKWAILVANQNFTSSTVPPVKTAIADVQAIKDRLVKRFGVPEEQVTVFEDEGRARLESEIPGLIRRVPASGELFVYVATRGYNWAGRNAYLAPKQFVPDETEETGLGLDWLIDTLDAAPTSKKLLVLDCCQASQRSSGKSVSASAAEMLELVRDKKRGGYPRSTYVFASCQSAQQPIESSSSEGVSLFASRWAQAFSGEADLERDNAVEITELTKFVSAGFGQSSTSNDGTKSQTPLLFLPDDRPPRLSDAAQAAIIDLLSLFGQRNLDATEIMADADQANSLANGEPEAMLSCGILLTKVGKIPEALEILEKIRLANAEVLLAHQAVIWIHFYKEHYDLGTTKLLGMLRQIPKPEKRGETYTETQLKKFEWAGRLRELAGGAEWSQRVPPASELEMCDRVVLQRGELPLERYNAGRAHTKKLLDEFAEALKEDPNSNADLERQKIQAYVPKIASPESIEEIRQMLEEK